MKKLFALLALICLAFGINGCTKGCSTSSVTCAIETTVISSATPLIASQLQCANPSAIEADLTKALSGLNLCTQTAASAKKLQLPMPLCSMISNSVVSLVAKTAIPSSWGCSAANAQSLLAGIIAQACSNI